METVITEPTRVKNFALFFKNYMSIWSVVVAALPIPVTSFSLIPIFSFQKEVLSTYTTLFCFLILGFIFYNRHRMGRFFFPDYFYEMRKQKILDTDYEKEYLVEADKVTEAKRNDLARLLRKRNSLSRSAKILGVLPMVLILLSITCAFYYNFQISQFTEEALTQKGIIDPAYSTQLMIWYVGIFLFAEAAFILMAIKEYLQDLLKISDVSLMIRIINHSS